MKLLIIGNPENRRVTGFREAWAQIPGTTSTTLGWREHLLSADLLSRRLAGIDVLRIESPGEDAEVERLIVERGAGPVRDGCERAGPGDLRRLDPEPGRIALQRQWFLGWSRVLQELDTSIRRTGVRSTAAPPAIRDLFDKARCHQACRRHALPTPELIGVSPEGFDDLMAIMDRAGCHRVFLKPRHGSSASGVVALRRRGAEAIGTAAIEPQGGAFYNSLRVRDYRVADGLREIVDCVCRQDAVVERWFPKCGFGGSTVDLRIVTIGGAPTHWVLRASRGPLTNLHLGNRRGDVAAFRAAMGHRWDEALSVCRDTAAAFPGMLTLGIDLMVSPCHRRLAIAEVNAFGDLLPGIVDDQGRSTYQRQAAAIHQGA